MDTKRKSARDKKKNEGKDPIEFIEGKNMAWNCYLSVLCWFRFRVWTTSHEFMRWSEHNFRELCQTGVFWGSYKSNGLLTNVIFHFHFWSLSQKWGLNQIPDLRNLSVPVFDSKYRHILVPRLLDERELRALSEQQLVIEPTKAQMLTVSFCFLFSVFFSLFLQKIKVQNSRTQHTSTVMHTLLRPSSLLHDIKYFTKFVLSIYLS